MSKVLQNKKTKSIKRASNPTLETIRMVEQTLSKMRNYPSKNRLWRALPKQVQYPTFKAVLDYLEESCKIIYDKDGAIIWTYANSPKLRKLIRESTSLH
ncbi:MAG: hypothetical protein AB1299_07570 [Thermoproteota archaeon]|nr:hypothetical protein [Candidatus Nitrosotenuis sp.]